MVCIQITSFLLILLLIHHSSAVVNNFGNKDEYVNIERTVCVGGNISNENDKTLETDVDGVRDISSSAGVASTLSSVSSPLPLPLPSPSLSEKVNELPAIIEDRTGSISNEFALPLLTYTNPSVFNPPVKSFPTFNLLVPEIFPSSSQSSNSPSRFSTSMNLKQSHFGGHYASAVPLYRNNQMKSLNIHAIPKSYEAHGPPINNPVRPYFPISLSSSSSSLLLTPPLGKKHLRRVSPIQPQNSIHGDFSSNVGLFIPLTPPDIKYDGWKPISGHISPPNHLPTRDQSTNAIISLSTNNNFLQLPTAESIHSARQLTESPTAIPSNSYGEPIHNPEAHSLKQSVKQGYISDGLPPQKIPEDEPFHVNQGPTTMMYVTNPQPSINNNDNHQQHHRHNELEALTLPNIDDVNNPPELLQYQPHSVNRLPQSSNFYNHFQGDDLLVPQLPPFNDAPPTSFSSDADDIASSYLAPPPSSFSSSGPYPSSRHPSYVTDPLRNRLKFMNENGNRNVPKFIHSRNRGPIRSQLMFPIVPPIGNLIPPRNAPLVNFRLSTLPQLPLKSVYDSYTSSSSSSLFSSGGYNRVIDESVLTNYRYPTNYDSHGASSSQQVELSDFPLSDQSNSLENTKLANEIERENNNQKFIIKVTDDITSTPDSFQKFNAENTKAAQALAQALVSEDASTDGIQIQGSKDAYILQIESANGQSMENDYGSIKHDHILSERLLHDIISEIERPSNGNNIQIMSSPVSSLEESHKSTPATSSLQPSFVPDNINSQQSASE